MHLPCLRTCIAHYLESPHTERVFVQLSQQFRQELTKALALADTRLEWCSMEPPGFYPSDLDSFERLEKVLRGLAEVTGEPFSPGLSVIPMLEKALEILQSVQGKPCL